MSDDWIEDQSPCHRDELAREWDLRREQHYNSGYREGLDQGKEETLQQGFDSGFAQGCAAGYEWGLLQGATSTLRVFAGQIHGLDTQKVPQLPGVDTPAHRKSFRCASAFSAGCFCGKKPGFAKKASHVDPV
ncbi:hypothetical protein ABBQ32_013036 [Trebouxia sp. C0010 RCD-2024]